jgi:hypothetical protein
MVRQEAIFALGGFKNLPVIILCLRTEKNGIEKEG